MENQDQNQEQGSSEIDPITGEAIKMMTEKGIYLEPNDPETKAIKSTGSVRDYLDSIEKAISAKAARVSHKQAVPDATDELVERLKALPVADVNPLLDDYTAKKEALDRQAIKSAKSKALDPLRKAYRAELAKLRRGDTWQITQLQSKYKKMGLNDF